jgi:quercetin dioxygenase-like cupin family protein
LTAALEDQRSFAPGGEREHRTSVFSDPFAARRAPEEAEMATLKDGTALYDVERRVRYGERPGFRITELQIGPTQQIPWHTHTHAQDTFYVIEGEIQVSLRDPEEEEPLQRGEIYAVRPGRPHLVTNGAGSATFLVLQGGDYDYVPQP